jgi:hypothetical protein
MRCYSLFLLSSFAVVVPGLAASADTTAFNTSGFVGTSSFGGPRSAADPNSFISSRGYLTPEASKPLDSYQALNALSQQSPVLQQFRLLRDALRGEGELSKRNITLLPGEKQSPTGAFQLRIGARPGSALRLAGNAQAPGVEVSWNRVSFGSTAPLRVLNNALRPVDRLFQAPNSNSTAPGSDESQLMWLVAKPLDDKRAALQLMMTSGRRDLTPSLNGDGQFAAGQLWGARGEFSLLSRWKLNTEWTNSKSEDQERAAQAWKWEIAGPITHPWGEANFSAQMSDVDWGYHPFTGVVTTEGQERNEVALRQSIARGRLGGALALSWNQIERKESDVVVSSMPLQTDALEGNADLNWRISPALSLVTKHRQRVVTDETSTQRSATQQITTDAGVQLKLARSLDLSLTAGTVRTERNLLNADNVVPVSLRDENRATVALQRRTAGGNWSVNFTRQAATQALDQEVDTAQHSIALEGEQKIAEWLRLRGKMRLSNQNDWESDYAIYDADRSMEAQFSLSRLGKLSLRVSDWQERRDASNSIAQSGTRETGIRYNVGDGAGLGLSVEYSRREQSALDAEKQWRIGITYR